MPTTTTAKKPIEGFSEAERGAMKARAKELIAEQKSEKSRVEGEKAIQTAIAGMSGTDAVIAKKLHALMKKIAPELMPKTWYGFPSYARDEKVICFFQFAGKFKSRYATLGFSDSANLDEGSMWPTVFALTELTDKEEKKITELVKKALS